MAGNLVISQINGGPIGVINAIINGNFQVNQRGVSGTVTLAAGVYGHDRWKAGASGCTYTFATSNNVTTLTITAGSLIQVIEGLNLYSGTYTLSFTGTAQGKINAGSYAGSGVTGTAVGGTNLNIEFNTGTVSLVQFEPGVEASPFERRDYGRELMMCQRYFQATRRFHAGVSNSAQDMTWLIPVVMRTSPSIPWADAIGNVNRLTTSSGNNIALNAGGISTTVDTVVIQANTAASYVWYDFYSSLSAEL